MLRYIVLLLKDAYEGGFLLWGVALAVVLLISWLLLKSDHRTKQSTDS